MNSIADIHSQCRLILRNSHQIVAFVSATIVYTERINSKLRTYEARDTPLSGFYLRIPICPPFYGGIPE